MPTSAQERLDPGGRDGDRLEVDVAVEMVALDLAGAFAAVPTCPGCAASLRPSRPRGPAAVFHCRACGCDWTVELGFVHRR